MPNKPHTIDTLLEIMKKLRDPEHGCPWDVKQTFSSIAPYTIEEAYEVDDAIRSGDMKALADELGDLLLQVVFHSQIAAENNLFSFDDVTQAISDKMIRRHPHVFSGASHRDADEQTIAWETIKAEERKNKEEETPSALAGIASNLPALMKAIKLQKRAAHVGFDWPATEDVLAKIEEESAELLVEYRDGSSQMRIEEEFGDLLFVMVNLGRHLKVDAEESLRKANAKFERRFRTVEEKLNETGKKPESSTLKEMDLLWDSVKAEEKKT